VVVGGGLIWIEMAEMLKTRKIAVTMLVRENNYWDNVLPEEEARLINRHIREHHVDLRLGVELRSVEADKEGKISAVTTSSGEKIPCQFAGIAIGVKPNVDLFRESPLDTGEGILTDVYFRTNMENVFAIGDCVEFRDIPGPDRKKIEQVWYTARMHGETLAYSLTADKPVKYCPGVWFNSAKFFDIEYQTYGFIPPVHVKGQRSFYWEHREGKMCFRMLYDDQSKAILGINSLGMRWRHAFFDKAIKEGWHIDKVMQDLEQANFNPEFFEPYYMEIIEAYNQQYGTAIKTRKPSFLSRLFN
jgi:NADPH-dependent 2,4-dienoyl-CoA reductase/sulfur reductase-like enzyme